MRKLTGFFRHILEKDLNVLNFVDSDFAFLNQRLAEHYGIPGIRGHEEFRIIDLPEDSIRGGVLTQGSVLKVTANGTTTSPVLRGVWILDRIFGEPPKPPPPGVPAVEPDIRGATSIREQLDKHRAHESCARCHKKIDPPGFALEEFDAIGGERTFYRSLGEGKKLSRRLSYREGPPVEPSFQWPDGRQFSGFIEFRNQILEEPETIVRAIAGKLLVYGTGRPLTHADNEVVERVVESAGKNDFGLRSMIHAVVESEMFHRP